MPTVWDVDGERRDAVAREHGARAAESAEEALASDVVVTVTPGHEPVFRAGSLRPGQHISLMGADGPGKAEVAVAELRRARLFCDDWEQAGSKGIGDLGLAYKQGLIQPEDVTPFGDVLIGKADGRRTAGDITLFDSSGLAIQDLAIAKLAYSKREQLDLQTIDL